VIEIARNVLRVEDATHEEERPGGASPVISELSCSLAGQEETIHLLAGTRAAAAYGRQTASESYRCSFGLNPRYRGALESAGLRVAATGIDGEARILELDDHPFFVLTLFVPQARSSPGSPHPLLAALVQAAIKARS
jgi:CTP synthase (UTP-ammonia lyase)